MAARVILAIDTALRAASACVLEERAEAPLAAETLNMDRGHAEALLPLVERVVSRLEGGFPMLSRVAVTVGPGSFTGLRVGIAAARAIGLACNIPVVGVSTLAALAAPVILEQKPGLIVAAIDARHANVYFAAFGGDGRAVLLPRLANVRDAVRQLGAGPVRLVGPGAPMLAIEAWSAGLNADVAGDLLAPDICFVAKLGLLADPRTTPARPLYLKPPDAKVHDANRIPLAPV
ncbi:MAG: tRNA (adenosine(37)-N6)-threonylcarbamoyltransferase complex dimerization subunit type 1 TsaB [Beijerinckiaceae bacterium]